MNNGNGIKVALTCIAKNEDHYIKEWVDYYTKLGVDGIYIYQNDWRCGIEFGDNVHKVEFDGECKQLPAYYDFIDNHRSEYDFVMVFDCDEYLTIKNGKDIHEFLSKYIDHPSVAVNWRLFGDSGRTCVEDGNYSLLKRFTKCSERLNPHVKQIINLRLLKEIRFANPHSFVDRNGYARAIGGDGSIVLGHFNHDTDVSNHCAYLNHYYTKTIEEYMNIKRVRGMPDFVYSDPEQGRYCTMDRFNEHNLNEVEDTNARDFLYGK